MEQRKTSAPFPGQKLGKKHRKKGNPQPLTKDSLKDLEETLAA